MNKGNLKRELIKSTPNCPRCGCRMVVTNPTPMGQSVISHAAILVGSQLVCFQCHRIEVNRRELEKLPFLTKWGKKTGITAFFRRTRKRINNFIYLKIMNKPKKIKNPPPCS